jgi:hypothetical protein
MGRGEFVQFKIGQSFLTHQKWNNHSSCAHLRCCQNIGTKQEFFAVNQIDTCEKGNRVANWSAVAVFLVGKVDFKLVASQSFIFL